MLKITRTTQLGKNVVSGSASAVLQIVLMLVSYPLYLHFLGKQGYGVWLLLSTIVTLAQLGNLGVSQALTKITAEQFARGELRKIEGFVASADLLLLAAGTIVIAAVSLFRMPLVSFLEIPQGYAESASELIPWMGILAAYVLVTQSLVGTLAGLGRIDLSNYLTLLSRVLVVGASILSLALGWGMEGLLLANVLGTAMLHLMCTFQIRQIAKLRLFAFGHASFASARIMLRFGGPIVLGSLLNVMLAPFNKLMTARYLGIENVPFLEIAFQGVMRVRSFFALGITALMPETSKLSAIRSAESLNRLQSLNKRAMKLLVVIGGSCHLLILVVAPNLLELWLGSRYDVQLGGMFRIMLIGSFLSLLATPSFFGLMGAGWVGSCFGAYAIQSVVNVAVVLIATLVLRKPSLELIAAAVAAGFAVSSLYQLWRYRLLLTTRQQELECAKL